jgi:hypothetical protein
VGHPWPQSVLLRQDRLIPLRPIPFARQRYCRDHQLQYRPEPDRVVADLEPLHRADYSGADEPRQGVV